MMKLRQFLITAFIVAGLSVTGLPAAQAETSGLPEPSGCSADSDAVPATVSQTPVVYVHGWTGNAAGMGEAARALQTEMGSKYLVLKFDYAEMATTWPVGNKAADCLAYYLLTADKAHRAGGGKGVLAVGHSMGGIALRSAAKVLTDAGNADSLMGLVTIATPHRGSPLGGTAPADFWQQLHELISALDPDTSSRTMVRGSSAAKCLASDNSCTVPPYIEGDQRIAEVGSQIILEHQLFGMRVVLDNPRIMVFGDGIVPLTSAIGYMDSGEGPYTTTQLVGARTMQCVESTSALRHALASALGQTGLTEVVDAAWSIKVSESFLTGKFDPIQAPSLLLASGSSCSHANLPTHPWAVARTADYLSAMAKDADRSQAEKDADRRRWLYEITTVDERGSGAHTEVRFGEGTQDHQDSTTQALGCATTPISHDYALDGSYESFDATVGHRLGSDPTTSSRWTFMLDDETAQVVEIAGRQTQVVHLDLTGKKSLTIRAEVTGTAGCDTTEPVGVLGDAYVMEAKAIPGPSDDTSASTDPSAQTQTAKYGWPTTRHDSVPGYYAWLGAATAWGVVKIGMVNWLACDAKKTCVGGNDTEVLVTVVDSSGYQVVAEFTATESATKKLKSLHATDAELRDLLRPG